MSQAGVPSDDWGLFELYRRNWHLGSVSGAWCPEGGQASQLEILREAASASEDGWHRMEVLVTGNRIQTALNGRKVHDYTDPNPELLEAGATRGAMRALRGARVCACACACVRVCVCVCVQARGCVRQRHAHASPHGFGSRGLFAQAGPIGLQLHWLAKPYSPLDSDGGLLDQEVRFRGLLVVDNPVCKALITCPSSGDEAGTPTSQQGGTRHTQAVYRR